MYFLKQCHWDWGILREKTCLDRNRYDSPLRARVVEGFLVTSGDNTLLRWASGHSPVGQPAGKQSSAWLLKGRTCSHCEPLWVSGESSLA